MAAEIHVNDVGTSFEATVLDENGDIVDLSTATVLQICFQRQEDDEDEPETFTHDAALVTDGTDGKMYYVTQEGDLDSPGRWRVQGYVEVDGAKIHSDISKFKVHANLQ